MHLKHLESIQTSKYIRFSILRSEEGLSIKRIEQHLESHGTFEQSAGPHRTWLPVQGLTITIVRLTVAIRLGMLLSNTVKTICMADPTGANGLMLHPEIFVNMYWRPAMANALHENLMLDAIKKVCLKLNCIGDFPVFTLADMGK